MKITKLVSVFVITILATISVSCATSKKTYLPDGSEGYSISCNGAAVGVNVCFEKAGEICGASGYNLINREGQLVPYGVGSANNQGAFVSYGSFNTKSIMIQCKQ